MLEQMEDCQGRCCERQIKQNRDWKDGNPSLPAAPQTIQLKLSLEQQSLGSG